MRDDGPSGAAPGAVVRLDSRQLIAARRLLSVLSRIHRGPAARASRWARRSRCPTLADGGPTQRAAAWLEDQLAGLQSLVDLASCWRRPAGTRRTTAPGASPRPPAASARRSLNVLDSLDPEDQQDLAALAGIAGLLQRYSGDPAVGERADRGGRRHGPAGRFTSLVPVGPRAGRDAGGGPRLVARRSARHSSSRRRWCRAAPTATPTASPRRPATWPTARTCRSTARSCSACSRTRTPTSPARSPAPSTCSSPTAPTSRSARSCVPSTPSRR